jgi:dephospho-CoA kinase
MQTNICLISEAGGGKDFLADYLIKRYGLSRYAFADNVKQVAEKWFPDLYGDGKAKPRWLLQAIGTMFRDIDPDVWIKALFNDIDRSKKIRSQYGEAQEHIVITDCRMPNEYEALKNRGFTFIRIEVDEGVRKQRLRDRGDKFTEKDMNHHTETFYNTFDCEYTIENNGSAEEAYEALNRVMKLAI